MEPILFTYFFGYYIGSDIYNYFKSLHNYREIMRYLNAIDQRALTIQQHLSSNNISY